MTDRTDQPRRPSARGPWPEVTDLNQIFDYGTRWCVNADAHPGPDDDYPDPELHVPPFECRSESLWLDTSSHTSDHATGTLQIFASMPYRFGQTRTTRRPPEPRITFEWFDTIDRPVSRFSVPLGDSLRLVAYVKALVRLIDRTRA